MSTAGEAVPIQENVSLKNEHTFHVDVRAKYFVEINTREELTALFADSIYKNNRSIIIGRGSNILFAHDFDGLIMKMNIHGKRIVLEDDEHIVLEVAAGEDWTELVTYTVNHGWGGIENLALIPGTVGAAPIQNIGAYGQNFEDVFVSLEAIHVATGECVTFDKKCCEFGYRTSIFKHSMHGQYVVVSVRIQFSKKPHLELSYRSRHESLLEELQKIAHEPYTTRDVAEAITNIRSRKLPNPNEVGNAGSFFKNPFVTKRKIIALQRTVPGLPFYPANEWTGGARAIADMPDDMLFKIPAAWLLEDMGWRGKREGHCGTWPTQPLSIVNYDNATPTELLHFIESVRAAVQERYGLTLLNEVEIIT